MAGRRITAVTVPINACACVAFESYPCRTPLLTIMAARPALLVTLTLPERLLPGHVRFARDLADSAARYAAEVERTFRSLPALTTRSSPRGLMDSSEYVGTTSGRTARP
jgi:hypothetical protein